MFGLYKTQKINKWEHHVYIYNNTYVHVLMFVLLVIDAEYIFGKVSLKSRKLEYCVPAYFPSLDGIQRRTQNYIISPLGAVLESFA